MKMKANYFLALLGSFLLSFPKKYLIIDDAYNSSSTITSITESILEKKKFELNFHLKSIDDMGIKNGFYLTELTNNSLLVYDNYKINVKEDEEKCTPEETCYWVCLIISILCALFGGLMSGLTVGYLSIDKLVLELLENGKDEEKKAYAKRIKPILEQHHFLLVTLLLANAGAMETLPVLLNFNYSEEVSIIISVTAVLFFGEIFPQAICTGPKQLQIAAFMIPVTKVLMIIFGFISFPISKILDCFLGEDSEKKRFNNTDLKKLISLHTQNFLHQMEGNFVNESVIEEGDGLDVSQAGVISGVIEIGSIEAQKIMIPYKNVFCLEYDEEIDQNKLEIIFKNRYDRIPVYKGKNKSNLMGLLYSKQLLERSMERIMLTPRVLRENKLTELIKPKIGIASVKVIDILNHFKIDQSHFCILTDKPLELREIIASNMAGSNQEEISSNIEILGIITVGDIIARLMKMNEEKIKKEKMKSSFFDIAKKQGQDPQNTEHILYSTFIERDKEELLNLYRKKDEE